jgi:hypothetical protein
MRSHDSHWVMIIVYGDVVTDRKRGTIAAEDANSGDGRTTTLSMHVVGISRGHGSPTMSTTRSYLLPAVRSFLCRSYPTASEHESRRPRASSRRGGRRRRASRAGNHIRSVTVPLEAYSVCLTEYFQSNFSLKSSWQQVQISAAIL